MLNNRLLFNNNIESYHTPKLYNLNLYDKFLKCDINRQFAFINNKYNNIAPNHKILINDKNFKQHVINGYRKFYYKDKIIDRLVEYDAFYPENFYYIWEILNEFKLINNNMKKILFIDDGKNIALGHIEACLKYHEDNFDTTETEFIRIPLNNHTLSKIDKRFISIYSNYKDYSFTNNIFDDTSKNKIVNYFKNNKVDFTVFIFYLLKYFKINPINKA